MLVPYAHSGLYLTVRADQRRHDTPIRGLLDTASLRMRFAGRHYCGAGLVDYGGDNECSWCGVCAWVVLGGVGEWGCEGVLGDGVDSLRGRIGDEVWGRGVVGEED
jgi:hypothetical protein